MRHPFASDIPRKTVKPRQINEHKDRPFWVVFDENVFRSQHTMMQACGMHPGHICEQGRQVQRPANLGPGYKQIPQGLTLGHPFGYQYLAPSVRTKVAMAPEHWNATGNPERLQLTQPIKLALYAEIGGQAVTPNQQPSSIHFDNGLPSVYEDIAPDESDWFMLDQLPPCEVQLNRDSFWQTAAKGLHLERI